MLVWLHQMIFLLKLLFCFIFLGKPNDKNDSKVLDDPVQNAMGQLGRWHIVICSALFFVKFPVAMHNMAIIFLSPPPSFRCVSPPGISDGCSADCQQVEYNRTVFTETIITQWDLICDKSQLANLSQTIFMLGVLIGNFGFGVWSDKYIIW